MSKAALGRRVAELERLRGTEECYVLLARALRIHIVPRSYAPSRNRAHSQESLPHLHEVPENLEAAGC